jgi:hypothetical protein
MSTEALQERIQRIEDLAAIERLMYTYAVHINHGWHGKTVDPEGLASVFAQDATWESADMQIKAVGLEEIKTGLVRGASVNQFAMHSFSNVMVEVDGDDATGQCLMSIAVLSNGAGRHAHLSLDLSYRRTSAGWRIKSLELLVGTAIPPISFTN